MKSIKSSLNYAEITLLTRHDPKKFLSNFVKDDNIHQEKWSAEHLVKHLVNEFEGNDYDTTQDDVTMLVCRNISE